MGFVDGKHIDIIGCGMEESQGYNYKSKNSIVFSDVAGSNYEVTWSDVGMNERIQMAVY